MFLQGTIVLVENMMYCDQFRTEVGGPVEKMSFFQITPMTKVSTQIHSSMCQYDVYKVSSKKMCGSGPLGGSKSTFLFGRVSSGLGSTIFAGFQVLSTCYPLLMTPYPPPITALI